MADDQQPDETDRAASRRRRAEGSAGDLARMGIDPRSLGLGPSEPATPPAAVPQGDGQGVPLRPEFARPAVAPSVPRTPDAPPTPTFARSGPGPGTGPVAEAPAVPRVDGALERLLAGAASRLPAPRATGRVLKGVAKGLATPDAASAVQQDRELVEAVRRRQTDRRVVAFVAGKGGVGCTTVALGVGATFAALREDRSVVVDVQRGSASLGRLTGIERPMTVQALLSSSEATAAPTTPAGLGVVDGTGWDAGLRRQDVAGVLDRLGAEHAFHLLDVGDEAGEGGHAALARADQAVLVSTAGSLGLAALETAAERVRTVNPAAADALVHVVVCPTDAAYQHVHRQLAEHGLPGRVVVLAPDPLLAAGEPFDPAGVTAATRESLLAVSAAVALRDVR